MVAAVAHHDVLLDVVALGQARRALERQLPAAFRAFALGFLEHREDVHAVSYEHGDPSLPYAGLLEHVDAVFTHRAARGVVHHAHALHVDELLEGAARGDIVVTGSGAGWVFDGTAWQSIGGDITSLTSAWRADISASLSGLVAGGEGSYITGITQNADGSVTANASTFETDVKTAVGGGSASGTANGITVSVVTTSGVVTGVQVAATDLSVNSIYASDATFDSTTVTASTLTVAGDENSFTVGGSTIPDFIDNAIGALASATETSTANGIQVSVTTESGAVTSVEVNAPHISADTLTIGGSTVEQLADKQIAAIAASTVVSASNGITVSVTTQGGSVTAVALDATAFGNVMSFKGVVTELPSESNVSGDIVVIGADPTGTGLVQGQEYIYDGTKWELIGDQNTYAVNAYSSTATVFTGVETVPGALNAAGAAIDALKTKTDAYVGGTSTSTDQGVAVTVSIDATTLAPSVGVVVTSATLFDGLDASVSSSENASIKVGVTQEDGKVTGVTADLLWLGADGNPIEGGGANLWTIYRDGEDVTSQVSQPTYHALDSVWDVSESRISEDTAGQSEVTAPTDAVSLSWMAGNAMGEHTYTATRTLA